MIPTQEQQRSVEKAVKPFLRARLRRSSHRGGKVQMIFDPWSNALILETSTFLGIPWSWTVGRPPKNARTKKIVCYSGCNFVGEEPK